MLPSQSVLLLLIGLLSLLSLVPAAPMLLGAEAGRLSPMQRRLLARWMSVSGGGGAGGFYGFPAGQSSSSKGAAVPPTDCAVAASDSGRRRDAWKVRVRTATAAASSTASDSWTFANEQNFDVAVSASLSVLTPGQGSAPAVYLSERLGCAFIVERIWPPLGLRHCERLELDEFNRRKDFAIGVDQVLQPPNQLLQGPGRFTEVLQHGYSRQWQLWLRSDRGGDFVEALAVRVLKDEAAASWACSVEQRWTLSLSADGHRLAATMQEFQRDLLDSQDEVFRLPTACHRVEL
ncbi:hypothetical protein BOX15_Mlig002011g4 [Macrostomum lignano]|uniref:Uncharacterized protein n=1 Tax=Macrostomum lignano TaxID=282301 RepID=A0A267H5S5_9PLAT|nr:hypothetical protein BOX15_Mlig002011g4 [Macrostomum lignano]